MADALTPELQALFRRFGRAFNAGDSDAILECVTPDFRWIMARGPDAPHGRIVEGRDALRAALGDRGRELADVRFAEAQVFAAGEFVVGTFRMTATRRADHTPVDVRGCDIYTVRDGLIASKDSYWKQITAEG
ncbi:MAG: nuclear transport factor 2 family protein [Burkholderiales bacterium]|nr:nuclear transport factor 2 family protein [Burkholderiales bacterium]